MRKLFVVPFLLLIGCGEKPPVIAAEPEVSVAASVAFTEGPAQGPDGMLYFTDVANNRILRWNPATKKYEVYRPDSNRANGLLFDSQGRLIACEGSDGERNKPRVTRTDLKTGKVEELAAKYEGQLFNAPNDVTTDSKGRLYFTDPAPDATSPSTKAVGATGKPGVYRIDTDGKITRLLTAPDTEWPNGLVISPDGTFTRSSLSAISMSRLSASNAVEKKPMPQRAHSAIRTSWSARESSSLRTISN